MLRPQARRAVAGAAGRERGGMEGVDQFGRAHPQRHMRPRIGRDERHRRTQIDPELRILLAEADGLRAILQPLVADRAQHGLIEARRPVEVAHADGDMVDHRGGPASVASAPWIMRAILASAAARSQAPHGREVE